MRKTLAPMDGKNSLKICVKGNKFYRPGRSLPVQVPEDDALWLSCPIFGEGRLTGYRGLVRTDSCTKSPIFG